MASNSPTTIADIARLAGVGTATVDRVLNQRPGVNSETVQRVLQVVADLGAPPQRGRPRKGDNFRFAFVLPGEQLPFFESVDRQIAQAAGDFRHQHITEVTHRLYTGDAGQFAASLAQLSDCDGIAVMAPDLPPVKQAINDLVRAGVHVVTLFSDVAGSLRATHIGADNRAAGRTAGLLLGRMAADPAADTFLLCSQATRLSAEIERRIGFAQVIEERFPGKRVLRTPDLPADDKGAERALREFIDGGAVAATQIAGVYNVGSGSCGIARALAGLALTDRVGVIGHEAAESHRVLLAAGGLAYLLSQDIHYCVLAAARVLRALCENVRGALNVAQPRVEILTAENLH